MNLITALFNSIVGFIQRNPITCLVLLILAVAAPAVLKGIAVFILYFILGLFVLGFVLMLLFRWRIHSVRRQMEEQFGQQDGFQQDPRRSAPCDPQTPEGEVKVYRTQDTPEKRVSKNVGDYVEFEETKETTN